MKSLEVVAYIDAGTGSYILAAIASGIAGLWFFLRSGMAQIKRKIQGLPDSGYAHDEIHDSAEDTEVEVESADGHER